MRTDVDGDGFKDSLGWAAPDDAFLALDRDGSGVIDDVSEISFVHDLPGAQTDMEGLFAYDSDGDGRLTAADERFDEFLLWRDANSNGRSDPGELKTLAEAGIAEIGLDLTPTGQTLEDIQDSVILNTAPVVWDDGSQTLAGDVAFVFESGAPDPFAEDLWLADGAGDAAHAGPARGFAKAADLADLFGATEPASLPLIGLAANDDPGHAAALGA